MLNPAPGQTLDDRFSLRERIGLGGTATVWKAEDLKNGSGLVAVKFPLLEFSGDVGSWSMFQREAEIGAAIDHPYIVRFIHDLPSTHRRFVVTEYVHRTPLSVRVGKGRVLDERNLFHWRKVG